MKQQSHTQRVAAERLQAVLAAKPAPFIIPCYPVIPPEVRPTLERPIARIIRIVAFEFEVEVSDILSTSRKQLYAMPRMVAIHFAVQNTNHNLCQIGRLFGRDHSTIYSALKSIAKRIDRDPDFAAQVYRLRDLLRQDSA